MNIALGSATLIRTAKPGCGAPASGFIASHHARGNNSAELVARKICPKMRRSRRLSPRRASMRVGNLGSAHAAQRISRMLRPGGTQLAATISVTRERRTRVDNTAIPARATSTSFGTHQGVPRCACANAMRGLASQPAPRCRPRFVVVMSAIWARSRPTKRARSFALDASLMGITRLKP